MSVKGNLEDHLLIIKILKRLGLITSPCLTPIDDSKKEKLFACFVDFRKAFDTVAHTAIYLKLLDMNVGGLMSVKGNLEDHLLIIKILKRLGLITSPCLTPIDDSNESVRFWPTFTKTAEILYISLGYSPN
jgi:uncharacterized membrane protein